VNGHTLCLICSALSPPLLTHLVHWICSLVNNICIERGLSLALSFHLGFCFVVFIVLPVIFEVQRLLSSLCIFSFSSDVDLVSSIVGIYLSIISAGSTLVRNQLFGSSFSLMFNELPQVDALWHFLNDIFLLRTMKDFVMEKDLFDRLIYIYRNPTVLIYWTREKSRNTF
jgi:hypothetical protein